MSEIPVTTSITSSTQKRTKSHLKHSNYFFTINTNKRFDESSEEFVLVEQQFRQGLSIILQNFKEFISFKNNDGEWNINYIKDVNIQSGIELGLITLLFYIIF